MLSVDDVATGLWWASIAVLLHAIYLGVLVWKGAASRRDELILQMTASVSVAAVVFRAVRFASRKHRNGWMRTRRLSASQWARQVVVVTGGARGLGSELVSLLAAKGARVAVLDVASLDADRQTDDRVRYYRCDVSYPGQVRDAAALIRGQLGSVSMLINNAGIMNGKLLVDLEDADIERIIGVNLTSNLYTIKTFLPDMLKSQAGHIVTVSSVMGHIGIAQVADYVATKHALVGLHESLRYELDKKYKTPMVRTTLVCPGHIRTTLFEHIKVPKLARFLAPVLEPRAVAIAIVDALERQESSDICLPLYANLAPALRLLPSFLRDLAQTISGADDAIAGMNERKAEARRRDVRCE